jgi:hypothetical protein
VFSRWITRTTVVVAVLALGSLTAATAAWAEVPTTVCVPEAASKSVLSTNAKGECPTKTVNKVTVKYKTEPLPGKAELEKLDKLLPHVNYVESGIGGKPTIQFSGLNVQVVSGAGATGAAVNGEGNLVIGYDEDAEKHEQTGSHNLVLGEEQTFTSYGGILGGFKNTITASYATVTGGWKNTASGEYASVGGGYKDNAEGEDAWVGGGQRNTASGELSSVGGGWGNTASGALSSISGGLENKAFGGISSVSGGFLNRSVGALSWVGGGYANKAEGRLSSLFGGRELKAGNEYEAMP